MKGAQDKRIWPGMFNGIGGHLEPDEAVSSCASRELQEETGLTGISLQLCGVIHVDTSVNPGVVFFIFKGGYNEGILNQSAEGDLHWVDIHHLDEMELVSDLYKLIPRVTEWKPGDQIIFGRNYYSDGKMVTQYL
ncbi:NUDIX domain-containing protein [bacterium]|nr:MAG: NUDIX domain-containing protein [bacterium]